MRNLKFVSFYTKNTIYEKGFHKYLEPSLKLWNLNYWVKAIDNKGNWYKNTCQKPAIILEAMKKFPNDNIIWIDCDAQIKNYPILLNIINTYGPYDIGVCYLKWSDHYGRPSDIGRTELIDGTIYINNTLNMKMFITEWKKNSTDKGINHQRILAKMLEQKTDIKVYDLPRSCCYIETLPNGNKPAIPIKYPVISHKQFSRKAKLMGGLNGRI